MDVTSLTRPAPRSTSWVLAGNHVCDQVASLLGMEEATARRTFLGEPIEVVLAMAGWALRHEDEEGFFPETVLPARAERRGWGAWRSEDQRVEECRHCKGVDAAPEQDGSFRATACPVCRGAGIGLKPLRIRSEGGDDESGGLRIAATPGALELLSEARKEPLDLLGRHRSGDWGELDYHDRRENDCSLKHGWRVLSAYPVGERKVWIITEADRSVTTILLPEEY